MRLNPYVKKLIKHHLDIYCANKIPVHVRDKIKLKYTIRGDIVYLIESRPAFQRDGWTDIKIAKFQYFEDELIWELYWSDRNDKWHSFEPEQLSVDFQVLLDVVDIDETGIFWG